MGFSLVAAPLLILCLGPRDGVAAVVLPVLRLVVLGISLVGGVSLVAGAL